MLLLLINLLQSICFYSCKPPASWVFHSLCVTEHYSAYTIATCQQTAICNTTENTTKNISYSFSNIAHFELRFHIKNPPDSPKCNTHLKLYKWVSHWEASCLFFELVVGGYTNNSSSCELKLRLSYSFLWLRFDTWINTKVKVTKC